MSWFVPVTPHYTIHSDDFPTVRYCNHGMSIFNFENILPHFGDVHPYRDDMFVIAVSWDYHSAEVHYEQGVRVMLPSMEVVWQRRS
jgi:hypothetical protein